MPIYNSKFTSFGSYVPKRVMTNFDLEKIVDTSDEWIRTRTGMMERHYAEPEEAASDLAYLAAQRALEASPLKYRDIDMIIVGTVLAIMLSFHCLYYSEEIRNEKYPLF